MSGGEPLSPELEAKIETALMELFGPPVGGNAKVRAIIQECIPIARRVLRAFAREIQEPLLADILTLDKRVDCEPGDSPETCGNCRGCLRVALLASQESCRLLAEALEKAQAEHSAFVTATMEIDTNLRVLLQKAQAQTQRWQTHYEQLLGQRVEDGWARGWQHVKDAEAQSAELAEALDGMLKDVEQAESVAYEQKALAVLAAYRGGR